MRKRDRENTCGVCGPHHKYDEEGEVCGVCGHRWKPSEGEGTPARRVRLPHRGAQGLPLPQELRQRLPLRGHLDAQHLPHPQQHGSDKRHSWSCEWTEVSK
ncbi:hypothetical protein SEVIR_1G304566v4 [Setaria viridis]